MAAAIKQNTPIGANFMDIPIMDIISSDMDENQFRTGILCSSGIKTIPTPIIIELTKTFSISAVGWLVLMVSVNSDYKK